MLIIRGSILPQHRSDRPAYPRSLADPTFGTQNLFAERSSLCTHYRELPTAAGMALKPPPLPGVSLPHRIYSTKSKVWVLPYQKQVQTKPELLTWYSTTANLAGSLADLRDSLTYNTNYKGITARLAVTYSAASRGFTSGIRERLVF